MVARRPGLVYFWSTVLGLLAAMAAVAAPEQQDDQRLETVPFLRFNVQGHTAQVRALAFSHDSRRLCSAGLDKVVHVWRLEEADANWQWERAMRWEVERGSYGYIFALAASPGSERVAVAGISGRGGAGDILLASVETGEFEHYERNDRGHLGTISSLAYSADGNWLASIDLHGKAVIRREKSANVLTVHPQDSIHTPLRPLALAGNKYLFVPTHARTVQGIPLWKLQIYDTTLPDRVGQAGVIQQEHVQLVTALAASRDGRYLASADQSAKQPLYLWDLSSAEDPGEVRPRVFSAGRTIISMCFSPQGDTLLAGTNVNPQGTSQLQIWDTANGTLRDSRSLQVPVTGCAISPDGRWMAYVGGNGNEVVVEQLVAAPGQARPAPRRLVGGEQVPQAAMASDQPYYRTRLKTRDVDGQTKDAAFDPYALKLAFESPAFKTLPATAVHGKWAATWHDYNTRLQLAYDGRPRSHIQLDPRTQGYGRCFCWITNERDQPVAIAVGTNTQHGIYVYQLVEPGPSRQLRYFWGHQDPVLSLGVSADKRYLISSSADGTLRYWSLAGCGEARDATRRWGVEFAEGGETLQVTRSHDSSPLYHRGVRPGDILTEIQWNDGKRTHVVTDPQTMLKRLADLPWFTQVVFQFTRDGEQRPLFQVLEGWHHLLAVYVYRNDWIAWSPAGYYACSAGGQRLIGWQLNNEIGEKPSYFPAANFYKSLYRPDVVKRLLLEGGLDAALEAAERERVEALRATAPLLAAVERPGDSVTRRDVPLPVSDAPLSEPTEDAAGQPDPVSPARGKEPDKPPATAVVAAGATAKAKDDSPSLKDTSRPRPQADTARPAEKAAARPDAPPAPPRDDSKSPAPAKSPAKSPAPADRPPDSTPPEPAEEPRRADSPAALKAPTLSIRRSDPAFPGETEMASLQDIHLPRRALDPQVSVPLAVRFPPKVAIVRVSPNVSQSGHVVVVDQPEVTITALAESVTSDPITAMQLYVDESPYSPQFKEEVHKHRHTVTWTIQIPPGTYALQVGAENDHSEDLSEKVLVQYAGARRPSLYVLAIGISEYEDLQPLPSAHADAESLVAVFQQRAQDLYDVESRVITDSEATKRGIEEGLAWFQEQMGLGDIGVVFFAGHGFPGGSQERLFLAPVDARRESIPASCISETQLKQSLRETRGRRILILDARFPAPADLDALAVELDSNQYRVLTVAASPGGQHSWEDPPWGADAFSKALVDGLRGDAEQFASEQNQVVDHRELCWYVHRMVPTLVGNRLETNSIQPPIYNRPWENPVDLTRR